MRNRIRTARFGGFLATLALICAFSASTANTANAAPKRVIIITDGTNSLYDQNVKNALGSAGVTVVGGTLVPGLGYTVTDVTQGTDPDNYTTADCDLIYISQSVASATPKVHPDDPVPLIMTEQALYNDDVAARSEMFFSDNNAAVNEIHAMQITNNTHPITQIFPVGNLEIHQDSALVEQLGTMTGALGPAVVPLAVNPNNNAQVCLAVVEAGVTGLRPLAPAGYEPTPARRVCLGYHQDFFNQNLTANGVYLLQRVVQWAIGDPVTAGGSGVSDWEAM